MRRIPQNRIQPKISTMPRQRSEAAAFLEIYKLVIEKKRLQQELENMEQRKQQISSRLAALDAQVANLENAAHQMRHPLDEVSPDLSSPEGSLSAESPQKSIEGFETFLLEY